MSHAAGDPPRRSARTDPRSSDAALRGRTYAIPFDKVWEASLELARGGLPGWRLLAADDQSGLLEAESSTRFLHLVADVSVRVGLDENGQTRVDAVARSHPGGWWDLGSNRRRIRAFCAALDRLLAAGPGQILDASREPSFRA